MSGAEPRYDIDLSDAMVEVAKLMFVETWHKKYENLVKAWLMLLGYIKIAGILCVEKKVCNLLNDSGVV